MKPQFNTVKIRTMKYQFINFTNDGEQVHLSCIDTDDTRLRFMIGRETLKSWPIDVFDPADISFFDASGKALPSVRTFRRNGGSLLDKKGKQRIRGIRLLVVPRHTNLPDDFHFYFTGMFDPLSANYIHASKSRPCPDCNGCGIDLSDGDTRDCSLCNGSGKVTEDQI